MIPEGLAGASAAPTAPQYSELSAAAIAARVVACLMGNDRRLREGRDLTLALYHFCDRAASDFGPRRTWIWRAPSVILARCVGSNLSGFWQESRSPRKRWR